MELMKPVSKYTWNLTDLNEPLLIKQGSLENTALWLSLFCSMEKQQQRPKPDAYSGEKKSEMSLKSNSVQFTLNDQLYTNVH